MKGKVSEDTLAYLLDALPFEFSFVDYDDRVQLFNKNGDRIFPRSESVIGLKVQNCHPHKSVDKVEKILEEMKAGEREHADFWINLKDKKIQIRYFAVRDPEGKYLGCLEVSQDITEIQNIEGEKRLLD
jgi:PAS domain S-box-containing protein